MLPVELLACPIAFETIRKEADMDTKQMILVVEDDEAIQALLQTALSGEGYEVKIAANGAEALHHLLRRRPALIFLDMQMPIMNGWTFLSKYLQLPGPHVPIIATSAQHRNTQDIPGVTTFLYKPYDILRLTNLIHTLVDKKPATV
jgi:CheY-like chemotaxis protein